MSFGVCIARSYRGKGEVMSFAVDVGWFMQCRGRAGREGGRGRTFAGHILYIVQNSPLIAR